MGRTGKHVLDIFVICFQKQLVYGTIQDKVKQKPHQYKNGLQEI